MIEYTLTNMTLKKEYANKSYLKNTTFPILVYP